MKRGTTSSGVRKKQIKMTMRHHKKPTMMTKIRKTKTVLNAEGNGGQLELSDKSGRSVITFKNYQYLAGSAKAEHTQTLWPSNATLSRNHRRNVCLCFPKWHAQEFSNQHYLCKSETMNNSHKPDVGYPGRAWAWVRQLCYSWRLSADCTLWGWAARPCLEGDLDNSSVF